MAGQTVQVDHFGFKTDKTFKQRYLIATQHWQKEGGSILFYTGNEGDIIWFCNNTGFMWDVAEELKAMLVFAEHRYYGKSLPFGANTPKDSRHLNFLTSEQALADFGELIKHLKRTIPGAANQPVIALGGSYGGMLAAWFRMKYPHVVAGNGDLDPWSGGGVTKNITDTLVAITIPEGAHHLDLRANNAFDPTTLRLARSLEVKYMKQWIRDFYASLRKTR